MSAVDRVKPGSYIVTATIRQRVTVEPGEIKDEVLLDPGSDLVDWEIKGGGR